MCDTILNVCNIRSRHRRRRIKLVPHNRDRRGSQNHSRLILSRLSLRRYAARAYKRELSPFVAHFATLHFISRFISHSSHTATGITKSDQARRSDVSHRPRIILSGWPSTRISNKRERNSSFRSKRRNKSQII